MVKALGLTVRQTGVGPKCRLEKSRNKLKAALLLNSWEQNNKQKTEKAGTRNLQIRHYGRNTECMGHNMRTIATKNTSLNRQEKKKAEARCLKKKHTAELILANETKGSKTVPSTHKTIKTQPEGTEGTETQTGRKPNTETRQTSHRQDWAQNETSPNEE